ncbi:hypothetical protein DFA_04881 [Cavenderia fasciculata]|uniref:VTT domain-containing protein n=1 Tax=Cavenderia fasciculata TaxID=261658 RepID=F4PM48_CACFS|nr:uncharacterized protein DFA_04881 [Cavenderia fasciculata]EGG22751.1 hypothetical protein DFA_04881 [Cavenderia fasciculata]|eukprot:XP_004360602.1 hypothetical protein DFA_04881 [Cavenderia fasciculata]
MVKFNLNLSNGAKQRLKVGSIITLMLSITLLFILLMVPDSPVQKTTLGLMNWVKGLEPFVGALFISVVYAISLVFCFPGTPINLAAGFLFGPFLGSVATVVGCDLGAILAFFIGRSLTREWAEKKMKSNKKYGQIDLAVEKNGFLIIFLLRLSPVIPFGLCNYLFGATKISFYRYWLATTAGLIPCTVAYTYLGSLINNLTQIFSDKADSEESHQELIFITLATLFTVGIIIVITIVTKRTLSQTMREHEDVEMANLEQEDRESSTKDNGVQPLMMIPSNLDDDEFMKLDREYIIKDDSRVETEYTFVGENNKTKSI